MKNLSRRLLYFSALGALLAAPAAAQPAPDTPPQVRVFQERGRWVEATEGVLATAASGRLKVRADFGSVRVNTGAGNEVRYLARKRAATGSEAKAQKRFRFYTVTARRLPDGVELLGETEEQNWDHLALEVEFELIVPGKFAVDIETEGGEIIAGSLGSTLRAVTAGGSIETGNIGGSALVETAGGCIALGEIGGPLEARTAGGSIRVRRVKGDATLETSGGEIVAGPVTGKLTAETAGGDVILESAGGAIVAETAGGQIEIGESGGSVRAETAGGSIRLEAARGPVQVETMGGSIDLYRLQGAVQAETMAGSIRAQFAAGRENFGASRLATQFGDVVVFLPASLPVTIDAVIEAASGHEIISDFPLTIEGAEGNFRPGRVQGRGVLNGGGQVLRIRTVSGNIEIRRGDSSGARLSRAPKAKRKWQELERRRGEEQEQPQPAPAPKPKPKHGDDEGRSLGGEL